MITITKKTTSPASRLGFTAAAIALPLLLSGCFVDRFSWSSDSKLLATVSDAGIFISGRDGKPSKLLAADAVGAGWLGDTHDLVFIKGDEVAKWSDAAPRLTERQRKQVASLATKVLEVLRSGRDIETFADGLSAEEKGGGGLAVLYLQAYHIDELRGFGERGEDFIGPQDASVYSLQRMKVDSDDLSAEQPTMVADGFIEPPWVVRPSPDGRLVAVVTLGEDDRTRLFVAATDPQVKGDAVPRASLVEEAPVSWSPDWMLDSSAIVYTTTGVSGLDNEDVALGVLRRRAVTPVAGGVVVGDEAEDLAGVLMSVATRVRCLRDGRILFTSLPATLPSTTRDLPFRQQLFSIHPGVRATVGRVFPDNTLTSLPDDLNYFEVSPDEKRIAVAGVLGRVHVVDIGSGEVTTVQDRDLDQLKAAPVWRPDGHLTFVGNTADEEAEEPWEEVVTWDGKDQTVLSKAWPDGMREGVTSVAKKESGNGENVPATRTDGTE